MNKKRVLLTVVALVLVCALSIMGTVAYLKAETETVTNTFVAAGGPGPFVDEDKDGNKKFELLEYEVTQSSTGKYTQTTNEVSENDYSVLQGTVIPKQAFVKLSRTGAVEDGKTITPAPAYLYIEVLDKLDTDEYDWAVDPANWALLANVSGPNGGAVYHYIGEVADENHVLTTVAVDTKIDIVEDDEITVNDVALTSGEFTLEFNAFLGQASTGESDDPADVFVACFGGTVTSAPDAGE